MEEQDLIRKIKIRKFIETPGSSLVFEMEQFFKTKKLKQCEIISINIVSVPQGYSNTTEAYVTYLSKEIL